MLAEENLSSRESGTVVEAGSLDGEGCSQW